MFVIHRRLQAVGVALRAQVDTFTSMAAGLTAQCGHASGSLQEARSAWVPIEEETKIRSPHELIVTGDVVRHRIDNSDELWSNPTRL